MSSRQRKNITIEPMRPEDIFRVREIEKQCFKEVWPEDSFERELENRRVAFYLAAHCANKLIGYMGAWLILDEVHITTLAVDPQFRNRKVAHFLVLHTIREAIKKGVRWATLEVGERNAPALKLYENFGFIQIGIRKEYYKDGENAIVMWVGRLQTESYSKKLDALETQLVKKYRRKR